MHDYYSINTRMKKERLTHSKVCENCGTTFQAHRIDTKFCGDICRSQNRYRLKYKEGVRFPPYQVTEENEMKWASDFISLNSSLPPSDVKKFLNEYYRGDTLFPLHIYNSLTSWVKSKGIQHIVETIEIALKQGIRQFQFEQRKEILQKRLFEINDRLTDYQAWIHRSNDIYVKNHPDEVDIYSSTPLSLQIFEAKDFCIEATKEAIEIDSELNNSSIKKLIERIQLLFNQINELEARQKTPYNPNQGTLFN